MALPKACSEVRAEFAVDAAAAVSAEGGDLDDALVEPRWAAGSTTS